MKRLFILYSLISFSCEAQTIIPGGVVSGTWTQANSPYLVQGAIMIANGTTLTIEPGVKVEFQGSYKFLLMGQILAVGNSTDSITFTATDTTIGWLGIRFDSTSSANDTSRLSYCVFKYGKANGTSMITVGGAIYFRYFSKVVVSNSTIMNCFANSNGAGIYGEYSSPVIRNTMFIRNQTPGYGGGAIFFTNGQPQIYGNTFLNNSATDAISRGGAISCYYCNGAAIYNNIFTNNNAFRGAGVFSSSGSPSISNNSFINNVAPFGSGICGEFSSLTATSDSFVNNNGTALYLEGGNPTVSNSIIKNNNGIGLYLISSGNPSINNNVIANNNAGGIKCWQNTPSISGNYISNNHAIHGAGIYFFDATNASAINNVICNNTSDSLGGGIYCESSSPLLTNNTIVNNLAYKGGALYCISSSDPTFRNCIVWNNVATVSGNQVYLFDEGSDPNIYYSDIEGSSTAFGLNINVFYLGVYNNNINSSPSFISPSGGAGTSFNGLIADWSLQQSSPCLNTGDPSGSYPPVDIALNMRIAFGRIDMGAYEYQSGLGIPKINNDHCLLIYPNPVHSSATLSGHFSKATLKIYTPLGSLVKSEIISGQSTVINREGLRDGIYFISVTDGENEYRGKMVVE